MTGISCGPLHSYRLWDYLTAFIAITVYPQSADGRGYKISLSTPVFFCFYLRQGGYVFNLFVCQQDDAKTTQSIFTKFRGKMAYGVRKNPLDFGGNPVMLR